MAISSIQHAFSLHAVVAPQLGGSQGGLALQITRDLSSLGLDAAYSRSFSNAELDGVTTTYNGWPSVDLNGVAVIGEDYEPLLLNSTHAFVFYAEKVDAALAATGSINITVTRLGGTAAAINSIVAGESFSKDTLLGWPAHASSSIVITGTSDLTNTRLVMGLVGHSSTTGLGYGS